MLLVDATTAEHARGIGTVIRGFLSQLSQTDANAIIAVGPTFEFDHDVPLRRVGLARTRHGRLVFQRVLLPLEARRIGWEAEAVDRVLLLDSYVPLIRGRRGARYASLVHDVLPLSHPEYWPPAPRAVKRLALASLGDTRVTLFTSTEYNAREIERLLGRRARIVSFGCGQLTDAEADHALELPLPDPEPYLIYVGALEPRKGLPTLLEAFRLAASELDLRLVVVGAGPRRHEAAVRSRVEASTISDRVHFAGEPSRRDVLALVANARALLIPTRAEGFCLPVLEALALGTPVVASDLPSIRSWAGDAVLYASARRAASWVEPIQSAVESSDARRRSGQERARVYRWRACATSLVEF